jgi:ADP-heptose:LPS heptosyltransferase
MAPGGGERPDRQKILVVRVGRGGDIVMITPALDALLAAFPGAEFHALTTGEGRRVLSGYDPRLDRFFLYTRRFPQTLLLQRRLRRDLAVEGYTHVFIFETKPHYRTWLRGLAPRVHALAASAGVRHFCDRCLDLVQENVEQSVPRNWVSLPVTDEGRAKARALLDDAGVDPAARLVGMHPTFSGAGLPFFRDREGLRHRMWPPAHFAELARLLAAEPAADGRPIAVVIDALPDEKRLIEPIVTASGGAVTLLTAPPDFQRYKGLLSLLDALVSPNTGPMHMAAALNTPLVALFSQWLPEDCGPFMDPRRCVILRAEDTAQPEQGLAAITPAEAAAAARSLIQRTHP